MSPATLARLALITALSAATLSLSAATSACIRCSVSFNCALVAGKMLSSQAMVYAPRFPLRKKCGAPAFRGPARREGLNRGRAPLLEDPNHGPALRRVPRAYARHAHAPAPGRRARAASRDCAPPAGGPR